MTGTSCPTCGDVFDNEVGMKIHHKRIHGDSISGTTSNCDNCGKEFNLKEYRTNQDHTFCSNECAGEWRSSNFSGENNPNYNSVVVPCDWCGSEFEKHPRKMERTNHDFCDLECFGNWRSENYVGENHHSYNGGPTIYIGNWKKNRNLAINRDNNICQNCGHDGSNSRIEVHHIKPVKKFEELDNAHNLDNLICLCAKCHRNVEHGNIDCPEPKDLNM
jgi:5-methylcytosine-specific restriction endonuclease McrA